jgi:hypothetical protein
MFTKNAIFEFPGIIEHNKKFNLRTPTPMLLKKTHETIFFRPATAGIGQP